jgi:hypothetical protein
MTKMTKTTKMEEEEHGELDIKSRRKDYMTVLDEAEERFSKTEPRHDMTWTVP